MDNLSEAAHDDPEHSLSQFLAQAALSPSFPFLSFLQSLSNKPALLNQRGEWGTFLFTVTLCIHLDPHSSHVFP